MEDTSLLNEYLSLIEDSENGLMDVSEYTHLNIGVLRRVFELYELKEWCTVTEVVSKLLYYFDQDATSDNLYYVTSATFTVRDHKLTLRYTQKEEEHDYIFDIKDRYQCYLICQTINASVSPRINLWRYRDIEYTVLLGASNELLTKGLIAQDEHCQDRNIIKVKLHSNNISGNHTNV